MVNKKSRAEVRNKKHKECVTVSTEQPRDRVWQFFGAIIICMLKLLTIQSETHWWLLPQ